VIWSRDGLRDSVPEPDSWFDVKCIFSFGPESGTDPRISGIFSSGPKVQSNGKADHAVPRMTAKWQRGSLLIEVETDGKRSHV